MNPGIKYLKDETGGRRFWPVRCGRINIDDLKRDRDQLWAEAVVRFRTGATWWLDSEELNKAAEHEQAERHDSDPWEAKILAFVEDRANVSITQVLESCIEKPSKDWTQMDKLRVGRCLRILGWEDRRIGPRGSRERRFFPAEST